VGLRSFRARFGNVSSNIVRRWAPLRRSIPPQAWGTLP
jgi:hypothetical protein